MGDFGEPAAPSFRVSDGQAMEFRIWSELIEQSRGALHVFLPLLDCGIDAVVHRLPDGRYVPLQVKSRRVLRGRLLDIVIPSNKLVDDDALIIAGLFADGGVGSELVVIDEAGFKRLSRVTVFRGEDVYWLELNLEAPTAAWAQYVIPLERLAGCLMGDIAPKAGMPEVEVGAELDRPNQRLGFVGESEVIRLLAQNPHLDLFRPFPDIEMVEVLARHHVRRRFCGLQVKAATVTASSAHEAHIHIKKRTMVPHAETYVAALAWLSDARQFDDECLLIPSTEIPSIAIDDDDAWELKFRPHSARDTRLDPYRLQLARLAERVEEIAAAGSAG